MTFWHLKIVFAAFLTLPSSVFLTSSKICFLKNTVNPQKRPVGLILSLSVQMLVLLEICGIFVFLPIVRGFTVDVFPPAITRNSFNQNSVVTNPHGHVFFSFEFHHKMIQLLNWPKCSANKYCVHSDCYFFTLQHVKQTKNVLNRNSKKNEGPFTNYISNNYFIP